MIVPEEKAPWWGDLINQAGPFTLLVLLGAFVLWRYYPSWKRKTDNQSDLASDLKDSLPTVKEALENTNRGILHILESSEHLHRRVGEIDDKVDGLKKDVKDIKDMSR